MSAKTLQKPFSHNWKKNFNVFTFCTGKKFIFYKCIIHLKISEHDATLKIGRPKKEEFNAEIL
ncbi:hypothetical protein BpHYR1_012986 [Brachionus plicatilis]|uniref:Uncharacterized protein n=1 Tax=Brachionus plicatilis TaxID=10195 RepID=A0A3M7QV27_BRAPC|nr:hypothetical protein BpHYR1_012986 [Brachionus plicatilis]